VCRALLDVFYLTAAPSALARPRVAARVLRGRPGPRLGTPPPEPA
jgi:hypothetical protein